MTFLLASVTCVSEALLVQRGGADVIDFKDPARGALGALDHATVAAAVRAAGGGCVTSATIGDLPPDPARVRAAVRDMAATGVDVVKVGLFETQAPAGFLGALTPLAAGAALPVLVVFADREPDPRLLPAVAAAGFRGIMLDTADKRRGGLRRCLDAGRIAAFVGAAHAYGLLAGLAGSLALDDVPPLLAHAPDLLGFRTALCRDGVRTGAVDAAAVARLRQAIPRPPVDARRRLGLGGMARRA